MYGVCFSSICLLYVVIIAFVYFSKKRIDLIENKIYSLIIITTVIGLILDVSGYFSLLYLGNKSFLSIVISKVYMLYYFSWSYFMMIYFFIISTKTKKINSKRASVFFFTIYCINSFIILVLPLSISDLNVNAYSQGLAVSYVYLVSGLCIFNMVTLMIINYKNIKKKQYIPLVLFLIFGIIAITIQYIYPEILLLMTCHSLITSIMYFTIENPDVKMIEALNQAKSAAEKANRAKSDFLSSMSHEIRTPLNAIVGFSDCILDEETLEAAKNDAKDIKLASENLLEIVNGILDISKIEANKMEIVETNYNPTEILENVAKLVKPRIAEKPIELITSFCPDLPYLLFGDGGKIRQIITNILTNAAKYTEEGRITFKVNCVNEGEYTKLVISVEDTGRGIKPEQIDKLFTKFQRLDEDKNTTLEGTGLGLAITKKFVEMLGGKIVVQSKYGEGSKFTVYLQQKIVALEKNEEVVQQMVNTNSVHKDIDYTTKKVLLVDDNKINLRVASKLLTNFGITADTVDSGFECLDKIKTNETYDLILLDDMMPKMSGVETLKNLKEIEGFNIPVVALTANAISGMREQYLSAGFNDYLSKPIEKDELARVLSTYLK